MSPNCFTYRATTTLDGFYIGPPFSSKYPSFKKLMNNELAKELRAYEYLGKERCSSISLSLFLYISLSFSVSLSFPSILSLISLSVSRLLSRLLF